MEAVYRILIRVFFPAHFRRTYERQVLAAAREEAGRPENQSALGRILLAHEVIGDLFLSGLRLRVAQVVGRLRVGVPEMQLAAAGGPAGVGQNQMEELLMQSANDRLKERASGHLWLALILSTGLHAAVFWAFPDLTAAVETNDPAATVIVSVPDLPLPPPPEALPAPAHPVPAATAPVDVVPPTFQQLWDEAADPPPPPPVATDDESRPPVWTGPLQIKPSITNRSEVARALEALYPPLLRDAGIGGRVLVKFFLLEDGTVLERAVVESSGHTALDQAALGVADVMRFSPAYNRESPVPVWVSLPIEFTVRNR